MSLLKKISSIKLLNTEKVIINCIPRRNKDFKCFLKSSLPDEINDLRLESSTLTDISYYLPEIIRASSIVNERVSLCGFKINESQLKRILMANKHKKVLSLKSCGFSFSDSPKFKKCLQGSTLEQLDLGEIMNRNNAYWERNPEKLHAFVKALGRTDLRRSLKIVNFHHIDLCTEYVQDIFKRNGFKRTTIRLIS